MNEMKKLCLSILFAFFCVPAFTQQINDLPDLDAFFKKQIKLQTFLINQFIDRFNFDEIINPDKTIEKKRSTNIIFLLNRTDTALLKNKEVLNFIKIIDNAPQENKLSYLHSNYFTIINCKFLYKRQPIIIKLKLILTGDEKKGYDWKIEDVESALFHKPKVNFSKYINPLDNEVNFLELQSELENKQEIYSYYTNAKEKEYNAVSSFNDYLQNGDIIFQSIEKIQYKFNNVAGYDIYADYFMRNTMNAGWLISSIQKNIKP
jgi:hypothetical protein